MANTSIEAWPRIGEFPPNDGVSVSSALGLQPTVAITNQAIDKWLAVGQIRKDPIFRGVDCEGSPRARRLSSPMLLEIVQA